MRRYANFAISQHLEPSDKRGHILTSRSL